jgi:hypothetical protein
VIRQYISLPIVREAVQWTGENEIEIDNFTEGLFVVDADAEARIFDTLHSSWISVYLGQWVIKGTKGEFYACDREVFASTYKVYDEKIDEQNALFSELYSAIRDVQDAVA